MTSYSSCTLCPRRCHTNRADGAIGFCGATTEMRIGRAALHHWEEPCLSGTRGAGTVFFCHCSLRCAFCQNAVISGTDAYTAGVLTSVSDLADTFLSLEAQGAHNIDLVTPTHYTPSIREAIILSRTRGLTIPFVWNSSGYETVETLRTLEGLVDIYLPDFKYFSSYYSSRYSAAPDYWETSCDAIDEMVRQTGAPIFQPDGLLQRGTIVRHLMLPGLSGDTAQLIRQASKRWGHTILFSLMRQFTPFSHWDAFPELNRCLTDAEYAEACSLMQSFGLYGYQQESDSARESFIPVFDGTGVQHTKI